MNTRTVTEFQKELKDKIQFKVSSKVNNHAVLVKAFKFFDIRHQGSISKHDFGKAIAKCGLVTDTYNLDVIYQYYDQSNTGKIDYRVFIDNLLYGNNARQTDNDIPERVQEQDKKFDTEKQNIDNNSFNQQHNSYPKTAVWSSGEQGTERNYSKQPQNYDEVIEIVINELKGDGICGLLNLANQLKSSDGERTHLISSTKMLPYLGYLSLSAINKIINENNPNKFGQINYAELVYRLKGCMNLQRQSLIDNLFGILDGTQQGQVQIIKIINLYQNKSQIGPFKRALQLYCKFQSIDDGIFTNEDFIDFFQFISFAFSSDLSFHEFIKIGFYSPQNKRIPNRMQRRKFQSQKLDTLKINNKIYEKQRVDFRKNKQQLESTYQDFSDEKTERNSYLSYQSKQSQIQSRNQQLDEIHDNKQIQGILEKIKIGLIAKGTKGLLQFVKKLKIKNTNNDNRVSFEDFNRAIKDQKIDISPSDINKLVSIYGKNGSLPYKQIMNAILGDIPEERPTIFSLMWNRIKIDNHHTTFSRIKSNINFRGHPFVQRRKSSNQEIWNQLVETILMIQDINSEPRSDTINKQIFYKYCEYLSWTMNDQQLFESVTNNFWKIQQNKKLGNQPTVGGKVFYQCKDERKQKYGSGCNGEEIGEGISCENFNCGNGYVHECQKY